jgi:hypothetical protein
VGKAIAKYNKCGFCWNIGLVLANIKIIRGTAATIGYFKKCNAFNM